MPPKRRRKFHGLYYHSSPPKVLPMNGNSNSSKTTGRDDAKEAFVVKPSNIRIWIHDKDVGKLTRVLWAGQGNRLRTETSTHPRVKKFLETVPYVLNVIKDVHQAVVDNNLDLLKSKTEPPVPPSLITTKDSNGLTVMHKAAGLAHTRIVEHLLKVWPGGATDIDATGKTPLHWAASAKNNTRCYNLLVQAGADEEALDYRMKTAPYYKGKPHDVDRSFLTLVPEAPRVPQESHPDWSALVDEVGSLTDSETDPSGNNENNNHGENHITGNGINLLTSRTKANTIDDTSEPDEIHDEQNNLTLEEQVVKAAIEDEQAFEQEQSEKDAQRQEVEDLANDLNANKESSPPVSPPPTAGGVESEANTAIMDNIDNNDEESGEQNDLQNDVNIDKAAETSKDADKETVENNEGTVNIENVADGEDTTADTKEEKEECKTESEEVMDDKDKVAIPEQVVSESKPESVDEGHRPEEALQSDKVEVSIIVAEDTDGKIEELKRSESEAKENVDKESEEVTVEEANEARTELRPEHVPMTLLTVPGDDDDSSDDGKTDITEAEDSDESQADADLKMDPNQKVNDDKRSSEDSNSSNDKAIINEHSSEKENCDIQDGKEEIKENGKHAETERIDSAMSGHTERIDSAISGHTITISSPERKSSSGKSLRSTTPAEKPLKSDASDISSDSLNPDKTENDEEGTHAQDTFTTNGSIDENHNAIKENGTRSITPTSPALEYEGVVQGEADDNQVQSQSGGYFVNEDNRIQSVIDSGDMEQLAALVLNGEGKKLMGTSSQQPEIQAFLDNVPSYMNKIRKVHQSARNGNARDLQAALDRRKFAIAKDEISPDGATPLHVATVFGHAGIIRYLGGRFPETTSAVDDNGRTALHYAATINDNGHFYNLLINLGSNPKSLDKLGNSAEYYRDNRDESMSVFSYRDLLKVFGANENMEDEMLADQDKINLPNRLEIPLFRTEQGRYLAEGKCASTEHIPYDFQYEITTALGDPLIKGLTEIAEKRPPQPVIYLANYLQNFARNNGQLPIQQLPQHQSRQDTATSVSGHLGHPMSSYLNQSNIPTQPGVSGEEVSSSPELDDESTVGDDRDEHGQSMLHFACARPHSRNALLNLIEESEVNITYRDELYRTARDVSLQANQPANAKQIDHYILSVAAKGDINFFENLVTEGYDHILDVTDDQGTNIIDFCRTRGHDDLANFLETLPQFEESREELHQQIRLNDVIKVKEITAAHDSPRIIRAKNYFGRTALHIAVLKENEALVDHLTDVYRHSYKIGDNLERTALHYAMGINSVEKISRILIRKGAKRIVKDLKGRQPSYYFMNKADILRLQEEEDEDHAVE